MEGEIAFKQHDRQRPKCLQQTRHVWHAKMSGYARICISQQILPQCQRDLSAHFSTHTRILPFRSMGKKYWWQALPGLPAVVPYIIYANISLQPGEISDNNWSWELTVSEPSSHLDTAKISAPGYLPSVYLNSFYCRLNEAYTSCAEPLAQRPMADDQRQSTHSPQFGPFDVCLNNFNTNSINVQLNTQIALNVIWFLSTNFVPESVF